MPRPHEGDVASPAFCFNVVNCGTGSLLTVPEKQVTKRASKSETGSQDSPAVHQSPSENLQSQLGCWLETGQLCSVTGSVLAVSKHKTAGSTVQLRLLEAQNDGVVDQWQIDGDGAIMCGDNMVLDAKSTSGSGPDELSVQTRRTYACSSQRWVVIPRPSPRGAFVPPRPVRTFKLISTSGKALDACSDGRLTTFEPHPGAETQRWRFICGPHGFYLENDHAKLVATLHWVEVGDGDGQLSAVRLSSRSAALYDRQLWSFDSKGFLVSRHSGRVLDSLSNQEGGPVDATARRTNVAGLGLLFKNFSTESQRWHVVPESRGSEATTDVEESLLESEASMILPSPSDFLDAALAELDEFGAGLRNTSLRCASPDGCDQALEALDDIANQLNQGTRRTSTSSLGSQDNPTPPRTPLPALRRDVSSDELWEKLVLPAEQNAALTQITEQIWTSLESDRGARLDGDQLKPWLERSSLSNDQLLEVWSLVDTGNSGSVTFSQLLVLLALIAQAQRGDIPNFSKLDFSCASPPHIEGLEIKYTEVWM